MTYQNIHFARLFAHGHTAVEVAALLQYIVPPKPLAGTYAFSSKRNPKSGKTKIRMLER